VTKRIIAFDPGGTTGWATWTVDEVSIWNEARFTCGQLGPEEHHEQLDLLLGNQQVMDYTIITESFLFRNNLDNAELISREYIGVMKRWYQANQHIGRVQMFQQTASMGKISKTSFVKKENLEKLGLWFPGQGHAMDAYGHLLWYIIHKGNMPEVARALLEKGWK